MFSIKRHGVGAGGAGDEGDAVGKLKAALSRRKRARSTSAPSHGTGGKDGKEAQQGAAKKPRPVPVTKKSPGSGSDSDSDSSAGSVATGTGSAEIGQASSHSTKGDEGGAGSTLAGMARVLRPEDAGALVPESSGRKAVRQALVEAGGSGAGASVGARALLATQAIPGDMAAPGTLPAEGKAWGLSPALLGAVQEMGHDRWFPVQREVVPAILRSVAAGDVAFSGDVAITAPTGSGKTLAYLLPILQALSGAPTPALRALVLLPTRELAAQVHAVAATLGAALGLRVVLATGHTSLADEAVELMAPGGVHMVVATPGRLVDHLDRTPGFTLAALQWLVVDEADRLLAQTYNHWVARVYEGVWSATRPAVGSAQPGVLVSTGSMGGGAGSNSITVASAAATAALALPGAAVPLPAALAPHPLRRVLVSATLTNNPRHMATLALHRPTHFTALGAVGPGGMEQGAAGLEEGAAAGKFVTPPTLTESYVVVPARDKSLAALLLVLQALATTPSNGVVLVFAGSLPTTHRLARLLQLHGTGADIPPSDTSPPRAAFTVAEFNSGLRQDQRSAILAQAAEGKLRVLVSSDAAARGLDLPNVAATVSYDPAGSVRTYIHRVGRAARAGRDGAAYTILTKKQRKFFLDSMTTLRADNADGQRVKPLQLPTGAFAPFVPRYKRCLAEVPALLAAERRGDVPEGTPVPSLPPASGERIPMDDAFEGVPPAAAPSSDDDSSSTGSSASEE